MFSVTILATLCVVAQLTTGLILPGSANLEVKKLTSASLKFSQKLYQKIGLSQPNVIYSPFSAHTCLSMAYLGARSTTAQQMKTVLELSEVSSPDIPYRQLIEDLSSVRMVKLLTANAMYINPSYTIKKEYQEEVISKYQAIAEPIQLEAPEGPEAPINAWVAEKTENKITSILQPGTISSDTAMILLNTIFFNGTWEWTFEKRMTTKSSFYKREGSQIEVDLMHQMNRFPLKEEVIPGVDVISLPFRDSRFSLIVALPRSTEGLSALESYITQSPSNLEMLFQGLSSTYVDLYLPKFKLTATINLKDALRNLGMPIAFANGADFSGISPTPLKISKVMQKAKIEVTEYGTVAAAASPMNIIPRHSWVNPTQPIVFKADRPFLYFLRDAQTGQILFQGKLEDPTIEEFEI